MGDEVEEILDLTDDEELKKPEYVELFADVCLDWETRFQFDEKRILGCLYEGGRYGSYTASQELYRNMSKGTIAGILQSVRNLLATKTERINYQYQWIAVLFTPNMDME